MGSCEHVMCDFPCTPRHNCIKLWGQDHLHMGHFQAHCCANFAYETWSILDLGNLPRMSVLATRHDSGMIMFKLKRERLAFVMQGGVLYFIKEQHLHPYDFSAEKDNLLTFNPQSIHNAKTITMNRTPKSLSYNVVENAMLLCLDIDMGSFVTICALYETSLCFFFTYAFMFLCFFFTSPYVFSLFILFFVIGRSSFSCLL